MPKDQRSVQPASLKWQDDGELSAQDVFNLVCRLRAVESGATSNELWRLGQKYPRQKPPQSSAPPSPPPSPPL
ncbi:MAG: hypothetical protein FJ056_00465 [Cyanobacteria bacterium M_surface_10_m2_179]|nr:hypothetical protein [Cyanobacteria bacterium M_surface_10_m2_179]